jgi:hypothetical protein
VTVQTYVHKREDKRYLCWLATELALAGVKPANARHVNATIRGDTTLVAGADYITFARGVLPLNVFLCVDDKLIPVDEKGGVYVFEPLLRTLCGKADAMDLYSALLAPLPVFPDHPESAPDPPKETIPKQFSPEDGDSELYKAGNVINLFKNTTKPYDKKTTRRHILSALNATSNDDEVTLEQLRRCAVAMTNDRNDGPALPDALTRITRHGYGWPHRRAKGGWIWIVFWYNGHRLTALYDGSYWRVPALQIGKIVGYAKPASFGRQIRKDWSSSFRTKPSSVLHVSGEEARTLKATIADIPHNTRSYALLTLDGVEIAADRTTYDGSGVIQFLKEFTPLGPKEFKLPEEGAYMLPFWEEWLMENSGIQPISVGTQKFWDADKVAHALTPPERLDDLEAIWGAFFSDQKYCFETSVSYDGDYARAMEDSGVTPPRHSLHARGLLIAIRTAIKEFGVQLPLPPVELRPVEWRAPVEGEETPPPETREPTQQELSLQEPEQPEVEQANEDIPVSVPNRLNFQPDDSIPATARSAPLQSDLEGHPIHAVWSDAGFDPAWEQKRDKAKLILGVLDRSPNISDANRDALLYYIMNDVCGIRIPQIVRMGNGTSLTATDIGEELGISANEVGRIAADLGLEARGFGRRVVVQATHNGKPRSFKVIGKRWHPTTKELIANYLRSRS